MIHAKIQNVSGKAVIELDEADLAKLGATFGDDVRVEAAGSEAVEKGKAFVERYIRTFDALAK
ncbi:MAG: hypothetical protein H2038_05135 [Brevundimonas sp.]|uniref:hypothetical protein n=1 Tax=Brevundimonas sp. TaxID=1871086 RepID=UPI0018087E3A|nr:hypothetical protein [Brevundimonas sp.]MBA4804020.1 hypothetical protein [Brevundimonas sp.]